MVNFWHFLLNSSCEKYIGLINWRRWFDIGTKHMAYALLNSLDSSFFLEARQQDKCKEHFAGNQTCSLGEIETFCVCFDRTIARRNYISLINESFSEVKVMTPVSAIVSLGGTNSRSYACLACKLKSFLLDTCTAWLWIAEHKRLVSYWYHMYWSRDSIGSYGISEKTRFLAASG